MKELAQEIVELIRNHDVDYGDVRIIEEEEQELSVRNDRVESISHTTSSGIGIRVMYRGFWGFSSTNDVSIEGAYRAVKEAVAIAKASHSAGGRGLVLSEEEVYVDEYRTPVQLDPFSISIDEKLNFLFSVYEEIKGFDAIKIFFASMSFRRIDKTFASTEGHLIRQVIYQSGGGYTLYAFSETDMQTRSFPASHGGDFGTGGYELILKAGWRENAVPIAEEAIRLLNAPRLPAGESDLIIGTQQMALQIHESVGHPLELDRVLGFEAGYAGTSWASKLGIRYGSPHMNIVQDATVPGGLGSFKYDDDGVLGKRAELIREGILVNYLSSRDSAPLIGKKSTGASRASSWNRIPIVRMTNVNLLPGEYDLEELISMVKDGYYIDYNKSWSIDQRRLNFQFSTEVAYRIRNGKLLQDEIYRNAVYYGITPRFWSSLDGVANEKFWKIWGIPNCGKGEPGQVARVGHGSSPALFRKVKVGAV